MPDAKMNGIEFEVKGSAASAERTLNSLSNTLSRLKAATRGGLGLSNISSGMKSIAKNKVTQVVDAQKIAKDLLSVDNTIARVRKSIADMQKSVSMKGATQTEIEQATARIKEYQNQLTGLYAKRAGIVDGSQYGPSQESISKWERLREVIASVIRTSGKGLGAAVLAPFKSGLSSVARFASSVQSVASGFKRIVFYRLIRTIIKEISQAFQEGVDHVYQWSRAMRDAASGDLGRFADNMDDLATSLAYFKNAVGAAVAPLANVLAPAIRIVTDAAVELLNVINQVFALLTGQSSWTRAIRNATEYGDAVGGAGGKAKEALKYLAPFDELNVLPDEKRGGGGGGVAEDYASMFEEISEFSEGISGFINRIKFEIRQGDWKGVGTLLGEQINGMIDGVDFEGFGGKIGGYINAWFTTKYWTLETINFTSIGSRIAQLLGGALERINFDTIGRSVIQKFTIVGDLIIGFIEETDWGLVASSIGNYIKGAFNQASDWLKRVDWKTFGDNVWQGLSDIFTGIDLSGIAQSVMTALGAAINASLRFLWGSLTNIGADIAKWWTDNISADTFSGMAANLWQALKDALGSFNEWIENNIFRPFIEGLTGMPWEELKSTMRKLFGVPEVAPKEEQSALLAQRETWEARSNRGKYTGLFGGVGGGGRWTTNRLNAPARLFARTFTDNLRKETASNPVNISTVAEIKQVTDNRSDKKLNFTANLTGNAINNLSSKKLDFSANLTGAATNNLSTKKLDFSANLTGTATNNLSSKKLDFAVNLTGNPTNSLSNKTLDFSAKVIGSPINALANRILEFTANLTGVPANNLTNKTLDFSANLTGNPTNNLSSKKLDFAANVTGNPTNNLSNRTLDFTARMTGTPIDNLTNKVFSSVADFTTYIQSFAKPQIKAEAKIDSVITPEGRLIYTKAASGGMFVNGQLQGFAGGGSPGFGQLFVAREQGPELVGTLGGHTAIMNNDQIVASVSAGVARAIGGIRFRMEGFGTPTAIPESEGVDEEMLYLAFRRALDETDFGPDTINLDGDPLYRNMVRRNRQNTRVTGINAFA